MIIDSQKYNGECPCCEKNHTMQTLISVIENGCIDKLDEYLKKYKLTGYKAAVYDENTYMATNGKHPRADREIVLNPENLHADEHGVELLKNRIPKETKLLLAVGSGTVHDLTRFCAYQMNIDFVSCPTAASVDGFCSSVAAMTWRGSKKTFRAVAPKIVLADLGIIRKAPLRLAKSGFGDMIGKYISLADWKIANILTGEFYCERIADITREATNAVLNSADGIVSGDEASYEKLMYGLLLSGLAMQMMGNSRPASGAEHHISHLIEMRPEGLNSYSDALHGEKVGVGALTVLREYHRIVNLPHVAFGNYKEYGREFIFKMFGQRLTDEIAEENSRDCAKGITADIIKTSFDRIVEVLEGLPETEQFETVYSRLGIKSTFEDIGLSSDMCSKILEYSPCVRNRLTLMRIRKCIKPY